MGFESKDKMVNKPSHYIGKYGMEVNDVIENFCADLSGKEAVEKANAIKYILRYDKKNGVQDLEKAMTNIQYIIDRKEKEKKEDKPTSGRYHWERSTDDSLRFQDLFDDEKPTVIYDFEEFLNTLDVDWKADDRRNEEICRLLEVGITNILKELINENKKEDK